LTPVDKDEKAIEDAAIKELLLSEKDPSKESTGDKRRRSKTKGDEKAIKFVGESCTLSVCLFHVFNPSPP
jgi:hypothetical protein